MPDLPEPEVREPMIPSKGYTIATRPSDPPVRVLGGVTDKYGLTVRVGVQGGDVLVYFHGGPRKFNAGQRKDFMLLWREAERQAEAVDDA